MNSKGLLVITDIFSPIRGGTAVWFDEVYSRLGGKEIHVVTGETPGSAEVDNRHPNTIHRVLLKHSTWLRPYSLPIYTNLFTKSLSVALNNQIAEIHAGKVLPEGLAGLAIAKLLRKPLVIYAHGEEITTWQQSKRLYPMRFAYRHANRVIANSEFTKSELTKLGVDPSRIMLINPGVDIDRYRAGLPFEDLRSGIGLKSGQKLILSVGRLSRRKGFDMAIRALRSLRNSGVDAHYALIGIGEDHNYLAGLADELGVSDFVHMLGHVAPEDLPRWYNACNVFIMPNREINGDTEGFGMVFIEAAACGKPAIGGKAGGTGAAIQDDVTGIRVNGESIEEIVEALRRILTDDEYAARLANAALSRARNELSWQSVAEKTRTCLDETPDKRQR